MFILSQTNKAEITELGRTLLYDYLNFYDNFEQVSQRIAEEVYHQFKQDNNQPLFALVRVFRICRYEELIPELQAIARPDQKFWMALMGTMGQESQWCSRHTSRGHQVVSAGHERTPMLKAAFEQLGLKPGEITETNRAFFEGSTLSPYFFVEHAQGSPHVPAQEAFVIPYQIQSIVGIGCAFISKASYLMIAFSKGKLDRKMAQTFAELSPYISTLLAAYDGKGNYWDR